MHKRFFKMWDKSCDSNINNYQAVFTYNTKPNEAHTFLKFLLTSKKGFSLEKKRSALDVNNIAIFQTYILNIILCSMTLYEPL